MARTSLMRAFQRLAHKHAEATAKDLSIEEVRQQQRTGVSRRDVLTGAGAVAAGLALSDPFELARHAMVATAPRIAIIGGGISGLNAALTLQDAGYTSIVYEASSHPGGRMHSDTTTWANGQTSEWCGELIDTQHTTIDHLVRRFGLKTTSVLTADQGFQQVYHVLQNQLQAAPFPTAYNSYTQVGYQLDHTSLYDWIEQYVPGGHSSNMGQLLDVAYTVEYGCETTEQSSLNLVYLLGFQPTSGSFSIFGQSDERFHIIGGNQQFPAAIAASLPAGSIKLRWRLTSIAKNSNGTITLTFSTPDGTRQEIVDRVILTLPFSVLRTLDYSQAGFTPLKQTAITQLGYGTNSKLQLQFDTRFWNGTGAWPGVSTGNISTDVGFQNCWDVTRGQSGTTGIIVNYTGGKVGASYRPHKPYSTSSDSLVQQYAKNFLQQLEDVWPGATSHYTGTATLSYPTGNPNLLGSCSCWLVGQYTLFSGYERVRQGKIHFAGEHCSINFQGFMEGAAEEGRRAAEEILDDYKKGIFP